MHTRFCFGFRFDDFYVFIVLEVISVPVWSDKQSKHASRMDLYIEICPEFKSTDIFSERWLKKILVTMALILNLLPGIPLTFYKLTFTKLRRIANQSSWWRHQMETFSALLALCVGDSLVTGEFHKGQRRGALMFSLTCAWINGWVTNREAVDLRRNRTHYDVTIMKSKSITWHVALVDCCYSTVWYNNDIILQPLNSRAT